jgi:putative nucleotidyltransferase with HDIG domain
MGKSASLTFLRIKAIHKGMSSVDSVPRAACAPLDRTRVDARLGGCACLPSLGAIDSALRKSLSGDQSYNTSEIAEIIRRDPSLTARIMRLVNAVHYGAAKPPANIDEAVFYLGVRQIRQLAMVTQVIEDFQKMAGATRFPWPQFWKHCIATALLTREITNLFQGPENEIDYVAGLIHDVGKIVMASAFPDHFHEIYHRRAAEGADLLPLEREVLGVDHADLGAMYLRKQRLPEVYVEIVQFHHNPPLSRYHPRVTAAVQVADLLVRYCKIGESGNHAAVPADSWLESPGWKILFDSRSKAQQDHAWAILQQSLERLPAMLEGLV